MTRTCTSGADVQRTKISTRLIEAREGPEPGRGSGPSIGRLGLVGGGSGGCAEALAAFYAYESQVPRVAAEKARGLRDMYHADEKTCEYFTVHTTADVYHSRIWKHQLAKIVDADPSTAEGALNAGEHAAKTLWQALDGIEAARLARAA